MPGSDVPFFWVSLFAYLGATILYAANVALSRRWLERVALVTLATGFGFHSVALVVRTIATGHPPFTGMYEYASCLAWATVLSYLVLQLRRKAENIGVFVAPVAFAVIVVASLFPKDMESQLVPALQSYWLQIHVTLAVIGEGAFAVAFASSVMYLFKMRGAKWLPSLESLDDLTYRAIVIGYPLFTLGALFAGAIWAWKAWGAPWGWDPKEVGSLVIWLIYSAYLHARITAGWRGKRAAILSILGFSAAILSFLGNLFLGGLHTYA
ncbi:MAG: c-type cytochrome biogenesis protein CcsB [Candidatus Eiseniibacteriota bacterium]|nr:MAG: c-type cytochrome biogenesis protein CcsB [Candidatus Eisenbacteria bacterium]